MADGMVLNCLVHGDTPPVDRVFTVEVAKSKPVDILKYLIKEKQQPAFNHIRAVQLSLWKVSLPLDSSVDKVLKQLVLEDTVTKSVQKLLPAKKLSSYFTDEPAEEPSHHRQASIRSSQEREQEAKTPQKFQKILGATSILGTRIFETIAEKSGAGLGEKELVLPHGIPSFSNFRSRAGTIFADKTMYIEHLEKCQPDYRYMFLRPHHFGKSAFLDMLCYYYDIHKADIFNDLFGPLYVGKNPTPWRNKHLVLKFDLSSISMSGSRDEMKASFNEDINRTLLKFLKKYKKELGYPEVNDILRTSNASTSLMNVLYLAGDFGHTLFVGVDEYDAPANNSVFTGTSTGLDETTLNKVAKIEQFFKESFFAVLKQGCGGQNSGLAVISKYFLTGVTHAFHAGISPLAEAVIVSDEVSLHGICGFTESEVKTIVQHYLSKDEQEAEPIIHTMQKLYNGYFFASSGYNKSNPEPPLLYNPHLVFHYIRKFSCHGLAAKLEESTAVHSTTILKSISDE